MLANGSVYMYYRSSAAGVGPCSTESIGVSVCANRTEPCVELHNPIFNHTAEDPSVFIDHRGNYHMLTNALPGGCNPKAAAGGHAWSRDGLIWSEPTVGAFNTTIHFTDGTSELCGRRERPQMMLDGQGLPIVLFTGVTGCQNGTYTLAQPVGNPTRNQ